MNCLFCQQESSASKSVEHIIPESLGNKDRVLTKGMVCDSCNQYFAIKIEKKLLEQPYFRFARNRLGIENKKGVIPIVEINTFSPYLQKVQLMNDRQGQFSIVVPDGRHPRDLFPGPSGRFIIPVLTEPEWDNPIISKFLAKVAVEALLLKVAEDRSLRDAVLTKPELEPIKQYARFGKTTNYWPYHQRKLYSETARFRNRTLETDDYEILHEWKFVYTDEHHLYFILCLLGIEYAINLAEPGIESFTKLLATSANSSALDDLDEVKIC